MKRLTFPLTASKYILTLQTDESEAQITPALPAW